MPRTTATARLFDALARHGERAVAITPARADGAADATLTAAAARTAAARFAAGLLRLGARAGSPVVVWSDNREEWLVAELALLAIGAPGVPRGSETSADEMAWIAQRVGASLAIVETPERARRLAAKRPELTAIVVLAGGEASATAADATGGGPRLVPFAACTAGDDARADLGALDASVSARAPDDVATIVFTSGTTGRPKGVVLTQANLAANLEQVVAIIDYLAPGSLSLSILPPWHMFERMVEFALLELGVALVYSDRRHFAKDLARFRPHVLAAVPRLWLALQEGVQAKLAQAPPLRRKLLERAFAGATERERARRAGERPPRRGPFDALVAPWLLSKVARALGVERLTGGLAISGGGTLPEGVDHFFGALRVELLNGYGLTETSPVLALRRPGFARGGTVGPPLPRTEIAIRDVESGRPLPIGARGVIHARGPQVMRGYFDDAAATARVLSADGWFDTGDLGRLDERGELAITGRAKDTIVLMSGENVEPEPIESALLSAPSIAQVVVVGQDRKFLGALVVPRVAAGATPPPASELERAIRREIDERVAPARGFKSHERIARFALLDEPFSVENGALSPTLKIKRAVVAERHAAAIDALFRDGGAE